MSSISETCEALRFWRSPKERTTSSSGNTLNRQNKGWTYIAIAAMLIPAILLLIVGMIAGLPPHGNNIERGVRIGGYEVSDVGWSRTQAELQDNLNDYLEEPVALKIGNDELEASPRDLGIAFDLDATHSRAAAVGRGPFMDAARERFDAHTSGVDVAPVVDYDIKQYLATVAALSEDVVTAPVNAVFYYDGQKVAVKPSANGVGIDTTAGALNLQRAAADFDHGPVDIPTVVIKPEISTADLETVLADANRIAGQPIILYDNGIAWQLNPEELVTLLRFDGDSVALDMDMIAIRIGTLGPTIHQYAENAKLVTHDDGTFEITPETVSRELDVDASVAALERALAQDEHVVVLAVNEGKPVITTDSLVQLKRELTVVATRGMIVGWADGFYELSKADYASALVYDVQNGEYSFSRQRLAEILQPAVDAVSRPPTGLRWIGGQLVTTEDSKPGVGVNVEATIDNIIAAVANEESWAKLVVTESSDLSTATAGIQINQVLGSSSTYYGSSSYNRRTNIEVAMAALNGAMIAPHSDFSFNAAIGGTATLEDGYMMGYGIISSASGLPQTVPSVAGGICQVATTTFQAAFWAGMPITNRSWHLYWIPKYGEGPGGLTGLDATVDPDYGLDFSFNNPTNNWLAISASADGEWITVEVWGTSQGWTVKADEPVVYNEIQTDFETIFREEDPSVQPGQEIWVEDARNGFSVTIHRVVTEANGNIVRDDYFDSYYLPARNVVLVAPGYANPADDASNSQNYQDGESTPSDGG